MDIYAVSVDTSRVNELYDSEQDCIFIIEQSHRQTVKSPHTVNLIRSQFDFNT